MIGTSYKVRHISTGEEYHRPWLLHNPYRFYAEETPVQNPIDPAVEAFHRTLPDYNETQLHDLSPIAQELGVANVFLKDESTRKSLLGTTHLKTYDEK